MVVLLLSVQLLGYFSSSQLLSSTNRTHDLTKWVIKYICSVRMNQMQVLCLVFFNLIYCYHINSIHLRLWHYYYYYYYYYHKKHKPNYKTNAICNILPNWLLLFYLIKFEIRWWIILCECEWMYSIWYKDASNLRI